jgi:UDP:flavonoid glycosyltransferase YjiC (YdhE family)
MVAIPMHAEQPANAQRLSELGAGVTVCPERANARTLAATCQHVLDVPSYRQVARGFQRQALGLPGIDALVADLTTLTDTRQSERALLRR